MVPSLASRLSVDRSGTFQSAGSYLQLGQGAGEESWLHDALQAAPSSLLFSAHSSPRPIPSSSSNLLVWKGSCEQPPAPPSLTSRFQNPKEVGLVGGWKGAQAKYPSLPHLPKVLPSTTILCVCVS